MNQMALLKLIKKQQGGCYDVRLKISGLPGVHPLLPLYFPCVRGAWLCGEASQTNSCFGPVNQDRHYFFIHGAPIPNVIAASYPDIDCKLGVIGGLVTLMLGVPVYPIESDIEGNCGSIFAFRFGENERRHKYIHGAYPRATIPHIRLAESKSQTIRSQYIYRSGH